MDPNAMATISPTQLFYLTKIRDAAVDGLVPAQDVFNKLHASKLSIGHMIAAGVIAKVMVKGRSHYQITAAGRALLPGS